jgi:hypothetical protein
LPLESSIFLQKPFSRVDLLTKIREILERSKDLVNANN